MAKSTSEKSKTTKTETAKKPAAKKSAAKPEEAQASAAKAETPKKAAPKKAASTTPKATKASADPGASLAKKCEEAVAKFDKLGDSKYNELKEKLEWCLGSYNHDKNPAGLVEYGRKAVDMLKEARNEKPKQVSQKLIDDLEKALAKF